jgi:hypothetical protein
VSERRESREISRLLTLSADNRRAFDLEEEEEGHVKSRTPNAVSQSGFRAEIGGANLWDLVQMECLARRSSCVRVTSPNDVGYLYFDRGEIIHATTRRLSGQLAALEILSWEHGSFVPVDDHGDLGLPGWPAKRTIDVSHEALILRAAQLRDEAMARVLPFPDHGGKNDGEISERAAAVHASKVSPSTSRPGSPAASPSGSSSGARPTFAAAVRLDPAGHLVEAKGNSGDLAPVAAYVARLAELLSDDLGLPPLKALDCRFQSDERGGAGGCLLRRTALGEILAVQSQGAAEHAALRWSLGLEGG